MESSIVDLLARIAFVDEQPTVRTADEFESRRSDRGQRISMAAQEVAEWLAEFAESYQRSRAAFESFKRGGAPNVVADIKRQIDWLLAESFVTNTPWKWLRHYPRYFAAIAYRLDKVRSGAGSRDNASLETVDGLWTRWLDHVPESARDPKTQASCELRWLIEELRVSLFAQPLGTSVKVSPKRCEKLMP